MRAPQGRSGYTRRMLDLLRRIPDRVEQDSYVPRLAQLAGIDERVLRDELSRGGRPIAVRPIGSETPDEVEGPQLSKPEREALELMLLNPGLTADLPDTDRLPFRDESGAALARAWGSAVANADGARPDLEAFVAGLDVGTAGLARALLASLRARGVRPDAETDRESLRVSLVRMHVERVEERLSDLQSLIRAASEETESNDLRDLERQFQELTQEREQLVRTMKMPALVAAEGRS
jgi:DNA primase